ncbi:hypothetical protein BC628DRAFT_1328267 [Trametes gibbosa]|nr:hypothetical protein BC628DRAFT_1328267 [Trametes gibbosa]
MLSVELIVYPKYGRKIDLKHAGLYNLVYEHLRKEWRDTTALIPDTAPHTQDGMAFIAVAVPSFSHVIVAGVRYGTSTAHRGLSCRYAYINGRQPVDIQQILQVSCTSPNGQILIGGIAIVRPFLPSEKAGGMPWAARAVDLGIDTWKATRLGPAQVVNLSEFTGQFALARVEHGSKYLWITMSLCRVSTMVPMDR